MKKNNKEGYDAVVQFKMPIWLADDNGELHTIYGILYNQSRRHKDDLFLWEVNRYISYLQGSARAVKNGVSLSPECWISPSGEMIILDNAAKDYIYKAMKDDMIGYTLVEYDEPIDILPEEVEGDFVIKPSIFLQVPAHPDIRYNNEEENEE